MSTRNRAALGAAFVVLATAAHAQLGKPSEGPNLGTPISAEDFAAWDISAGPDGATLPPGEGTAAAGKLLYEQYCLACHGQDGAGQPNDQLVGGRGTLQEAAPVRTVGSYWPYATTLFDYIRRAMPYTQPQSLTADQTYALTAYLLHLNGIIGENEPMNARTLPAVQMPNRDNFDPAYPGDLHARLGAAQSCESSGGLEFICGPKNAEDLVAVPGTNWIIASGMADGAGLFAIDASTREWSVLYPGEAPKARHDARRYPACSTPPAPDALNLHGLSLRAGERGRATLYAVGHGAREAIEVFDVDTSGARPEVTWTGCVEMPEGLAANSVASFADGSLLATVLILPGKTFADSVAKRSTGAVLEWSPGDTGFRMVAGTGLPGNNGIETSADGREFYVVSSGYQTVVAFARGNPARMLRSSPPLPFTPDNIHLGADGRLYTAGMKNDEPACGGAPGPKHDLAALSTCPRGTIGVALDPATLDYDIVVDTPANASFSNATMVLPVNGRGWIGTFSGDRIASAPLLR